ncbi:MAG: hypothetical protein ACTHMS_03200 [Jatrophihabitans sp.]|uniref:hypothetical protein n=1 Tax=Jatrophihabitans sp. TaxID=1932789 RepID=UPI003F806343
MPSAPHAQRSNVIGRALAHGWTHEMAVYDGGNIIRDVFTHDVGIIWAVWLRTPWSDSGRWTGSVFSERATKNDRNVWAVSGKNGILELLSSVSSN